MDIIILINTNCLKLFKTINYYKTYLDHVGERPSVSAGSIDSGLSVTKIKIKVLIIILHRRILRRD